jgi:hypothetical protein
MTSQAFSPLNRRTALAFIERLKAKAGLLWKEAFLGGRLANICVNASSRFWTIRSSPRSTHSRTHGDNSSQLILF